MIITVRNFVELTGGESIQNALQLITTLWTPFSLFVVDSSTYVVTTIQNGTFYEAATNQIMLNLPTWELALQLLNPSHALSAIHKFYNSRSVSFLVALLTPSFVVFGTEVLVDWLKHAFITKFNQLRPTVYSRFFDSLCRDLIGNARHKSSTDSKDDTTASQGPDEDEEIRAKRQMVWYFS
jgi:TM2 domain-containing membrane protein YozV